MFSRVRITVLAVLVLAALSFLVIRVEISRGLFTSVPANTQIACRIVPTADGPEEIAFDPVSRLVFVSARDRRKPRAAPSPNDGLYVFSIDKPGAILQRVSGVPKNFHPHGMSLYRDHDGRLTLMVINHRAKKSSVIEIFDASVSADGVQLSHRATVEGSLLISPNDVVAVARDRFYVTNDRDSADPNGWGVWLERNLLLARTKLVYFNGDKLTVAVPDIQSGNGIGVSPDGTKLYVAELSARRIRVFDRDPMMNSLSVPEDAEKREFPLPFGIDNIDVEPDGSITAAGHVKIGPSRAFLKHPDRPSPSVVYLVSTRDGYPISSKLLFADDGKRLGASSTGVKIGNRLIIGSPFEKKILDCTL